MSTFANSPISPVSLSKEAFIATYGGVYEHSPWIAEQTFSAGLTAQCDDPAFLSTRMAAQVEAAGQEAQMALLCAHPDLAGKLATSGALTEESTSEQSGAGLDGCTAQEFDRFQSLNDAYVAKNKFPFILAVAGRHRTEILEIFEHRINNDIKTEFREALDQVHRIALLRLNNLAQES